MKIASLFTALINIDSELYQFEIEKGFYLTSADAVKKTVIKNTLPAIGGLEFQSIIDNKILAFAYIKDNITDETKYNKLHDFLFSMDNYITALWLIKDNSIYKELGYLSYDNNTKFFSNFIAQINSEHTGKKKVTSYSIEELKSAIPYYRKINILMVNDNEFEFTEFTPESNRLSRALYFINGARLIPDIGVKYTLFCTSLESLLTTETNNIKRSLAERVEMILKDLIPNVKSYIYKSYEYRSQIIHGNTFKESELKKQNKLISNLSFLDEICRLVIRAIMDNPELEKVFKKNDNDIDKYFKKAVSNRV
ncbi:hypothetical protein ACIGCP_19515 [Cellulophaga baltica]|uniref:hypothetical protein n=1 Tax=Cellulophaga baltica TaxID=76594 RepID=UPI0037C5D998